MHMTSRRPFNEAAKQFPNDARAIRETWKVLRNDDFGSPEELKRVFPSLDNFRYKDCWWVTDIGR